MDKRDYETYLSLFKHMSNFMKVPSLIVHLDCSPEESHRYVSQRRLRDSMIYDRSNYSHPSCFLSFTIITLSFPSPLSLLPCPLSMYPPSLLGHDCSRIKMRSRDCESGISLEYLTNLYNGYEEFIKEISRVIPVIKVNYERFRTTDEMVEAIAQQYASLSNIKHVLYDDNKAKDELVSSKMGAATTTPPASTTNTSVKDA